MSRRTIFLAVISLVAGFAAGWFACPPAAPPADDAPTTTVAWRDGLGARPVFVDVTAASGIDFVHENGQSGEFQYLEIMGGGVALFDYDRDGRLDIYFVNGNRIGSDASPEIRNRLYRNEGDLRFTDATERAGVGDAGYGQGCCAGDYDGDGDDDLYVTNHGPNVLYQNAGDGTFTEVAKAAGVDDAGWGQSCSFLDYDLDGDLDLYVQNYLTLAPGEGKGSEIRVGNEIVRDYPSPIGFRGSPDRLLRNDGGDKFTDVTRESGLFQADGKGMGVACADFDQDGHVDIFVANDSAPNFYFRGLPGGKFVEDGLIAGVAFNDAGVPEASMGVDIGDYDRDGRMDLIVPCLARQFFTLYRNAGERFVDVSVPSGLARATARATGFNASFLDYDDDGDLDIFFANGGVRANELAPASASYIERYGIADILVANDGNGRFVDASADAGPYFASARIGRGSATGDLDGDGDVDVVISNLADRPVVLRNDTAGGHWLALELVDRRGRRNPFGARLRVVAGEVTQHAVVHGAVSYLSQSERRPRFGIGSASAASEVEIIWPGGVRQMLRDVAADQVLVVREREG